MPEGTFLNAPLLVDERLILQARARIRTTVYDIIDVYCSMVPGGIVKQYQTYDKVYEA